LLESIHITKENMKHFNHFEQNIFGEIHSFSGTAKEIYGLIRILLYEGVAFRYHPTTIDQATITHISDESYEKLVEKGRIVNPT